MSHDLTPTAVKVLEGTATYPQGQLPSVSCRILSRLLAGSPAYRVDSDGYRLSAQDAVAMPVGPAFISTEGRRAALTQAQMRALTVDVAADGSLAAGTGWPVAHALAGMSLAEYRNTDGTRQQDDGDRGAGGPANVAYRTTLGRQIADLPRDVCDA